MISTFYNSFIVVFLVCGICSCVGDGDGVENENRVLYTPTSACGIVKELKIRISFPCLILSSSLSLSLSYLDETVERLKAKDEIP